MPASTVYYCKVCKHYSKKNHESFCCLRKKQIFYPLYTTCENWNEDTQIPTGPLYSFLYLNYRNKYELKYATIPYYKYIRPQYDYKFPFGTVISIQPNAETRPEFPDVESYLEFCKKHNNKSNT